MGVATTGSLSYPDLKKQKGKNRLPGTSWKTDLVSGDLSHGRNSVAVEMLPKMERETFLLYHFLFSDTVTH